MLGLLLLSHNLFSKELDGCLDPPMPAATAADLSAPPHRPVSNATTAQSVYMPATGVANVWFPFQSHSRQAKNG